MAVDEYSFAGRHRAFLKSAEFLGGRSVLMRPISLPV
jgi:hypothetical protein